MKKIILIFALTALMGIVANAEENNNIQQQGGSTASVTSAPQSNLGNSFMAAFGMEVSANAGGSGQAGPGMGSSAGGSAGTMSVGMSTISTTSSNQVTPSFTPYSYQK